MRTATLQVSRFAPALAATIALASPMSAEPHQHDQPPHVTVSGDAELRVEPDLATITVGVTEEAEDAGAAQAAVNRVGRDILAALTKLEIADENIQTSRLTLNPIYDHGDRRKPLVIGYRASNTVTVRVTDLDLVGPVVDAAVGAGGNEIQGIQFLLEDDEAARLEALGQAVADARAKAEAIATALGEPLGDVIKASEGGARVQPIYQEARMLGFADSAAPPTPVAEGKVTVRAEVSLVYGLGEE